MITQAVGVYVLYYWVTHQDELGAGVYNCKIILDLGNYIGIPTYTFLLEGCNTCMYMYASMQIVQDFTFVWFYAFKTEIYYFSFKSICNPYNIDLFLVFLKGFLMYHYLWIIPLHLIVATYLMWLEIQFSAFVATTLIVLQIPVQMLLTRAFTKFKYVCLFFSVCTSSNYRVIPVSTCYSK